MDQNINRIKVALAENNKTNKWLAEQLGVAQATVSKWVTNGCQPPIETFMKIAILLNTDMNSLVRLEAVSVDSLASENSKVSTK